MEDKTISIKSAEDFWGFTQDFISKDGYNFDELDIVFEGWPLLYINVKGDKFHSSLTASMIAGMASMHEAFQRAYAVAKYGSPKLNLLTNEDKQALDVVFRVEEGSTESTTDWSFTTNNAIDFLQRTMENMSGVEKMTVLLALISALTICGCYYLHCKKTEKKGENDSKSEDIKTVVSGMKDAFTIAAELKSKGETPASRDIEQLAETAKGAVLKSVANDAESAVVGGESYSGAQLLDFKNRQAKNRDSRESFDNFYILGLHRSGISTDFNLQVQRTSNGETFNLKVSEEMTRPNELPRLANAILTHEVLRISYLEVRENGAVVRGQYNMIIDEDHPPMNVAWDFKLKSK
ncbi:TPA: hypothetical protein ACIJRQ_002702 [Klebsiella oxytoca]|uniref:hypothetical protein n=1 Tax=Klebsiella TaxID=570 RepID=UPI0010609812|nr:MULTISPECIES: hypothetical protein [Klebsiella]QHI88680.1 hypothetical protein GUC22_17930 [Klebsiella sp. MPUS7]HBM3240791.1 hypothetical protein [Klebsiella oxytoca]